MRYLFLLIIFLFISILSFGQTVSKVGGVNKDAISKIGSASTTSIAKIGNIDAPAYCKNCMEILTNNPGSSDGVYTIDPDGSGPIEPFDCYCDMTTDGGGWAMVGYYNGLGTYQSLMVAQSNISVGSEVSNPDPSSPWVDWRILSGISWPAEFAVILDQTTFTSGWDAYTAKVIFRVKNRNILPNYGTSPNLDAGDNLYYKFTFPPGWTDVGSNSTSSTDFWYPYASGGSYLILFNNSGDGAYYGGGVPGGNNSWHHSARMFIR